LKGLEIVLKNNIFNFDGKTYKQISGTAMGTKMAPSYATLTLGYLEECILYPKIENVFGTDILHYFKENFQRFLDDGFFIANSNFNEEMEETFFNTINNRLKFTMEKSKEKINFLDITVEINEQGTISTDIFYKMTDSHQYLDFYSCHPKHVRTNIPYNMMRRISRIVSNKEQKYQRFAEMAKWLKLRNYPEQLINDAIEKCSDDNQSIYRSNDKQEETNGNTINFVTTFNPNNPEIYPTVNKCFDILKMNDETKNVFKNNSLRKSYKQPKNLKKLLTKAKFETEKIILKVNKCNKPRCKTCLSIIVGTEMQMENGEIFKINSNMNCNSRNLIYILKCNGCPRTYIGETSDALNLRINVHRQQIRDPNLRHLYVSKHLSSCPTNLDVKFKVMPIRKIFSNDTILRRNFEQDMINKFKPSLNRT
jgi:hypothetical protein